MRFTQRINKQFSNLKEKITNFYQDYDQSNISLLKNPSYNNIDDNKDLLRSSLKFSTYAPLIIQSYLWLYGVYAIYSILKTIVLVPVQIMLSIVNILFKSLKMYKIKYFTMQSWIVLAVSLTFMLHYDIFDISFMYHLLRGQSTVKVYAIVFALQSCQIVLTKAGVFLHSNIKDKLTNKDVANYKLIPEFVIGYLYTFVHTYLMFVQFLIYSVVLTSSMESFVIFWGVIYLTKMKNSPVFTVDLNKYKDALTSDSKYRVNRIVFLFLFLINSLQVQISSRGLKLLFILFFEQVFILVKHMLYLLSNYTGKDDMLAIKVRQDMYKCMYLDTKSSSIDKCVSQNFTVLPSAAFCIKILSIIIYSNWKPNFLAYLTFYVMVLVLMGIYILFIIVIKFFEEFAHKKSKEEKDNAIFNSLCIALLESLPKQKVNQNISVKNDEVKEFKLKKTSSILQSMILTINLDQNAQKQKQKKLNQKQPEQDFFLASTKKTKKKK